MWRGAAIFRVDGKSRSGRGEKNSGKYPVLVKILRNADFVNRYF